jgi:hypothetical protein
MRAGMVAMADGPHVIAPVVGLHNFVEDAA